MLNQFINNRLSIIQIILPLGISFFTFTQIAFLVDCYKGKVSELSIINYTLFVTFFPHLLAGPIIHHSEMMPQFSNKENKQISWSNVYGGMILFSIGLFKKVVIADYFVETINSIYELSSKGMVPFWDSWTASLGYSLQIYYDFSGYTDMALGVAMLFNIFLPINFNSPYKAISIQDFWRRWHITLSRFLRDYLYIPLGGNRCGAIRTEVNIAIVFILGGIWHGAGFTFIIWGILHALGYLISKIWSFFGIRLSNIVKIILTFLFVNITWVFFRANDLHSAKNMILSMFNFSRFNNFNKLLIPIIAILVLSMVLPNSNFIAKNLKNYTNKYTLCLLFLMIIISLFVIGINTNTPFIYFQF